MKYTLRVLSVTLITFFLLSCEGKKAAKEEVLAENKRISDSIANEITRQEKEKEAARAKKRLGYDIGDTIPFGKMQLVVHEAEKMEIRESSPIKNYRNISYGKGKPFGVMLKVSFINNGDSDAELPFTYFQTNSDIPIRTASRLFTPEKSKSFLKDYAIKPGKVLTGTYQAHGEGNASTLIFVNTDDTELDEQVERLAKRNGLGGYFTYITDDYKGPVGKVNLKEAFRIKAEENTEE